MRIKDALSSSTKREKERVAMTFFIQEAKGYGNIGPMREPVLVPVLGGSHFCLGGGGEPTSSGPLMMLWEPDRFSNERIFLGLVTIGQVIKNFSLKHLPGSQIGWFSYIQPPVFTTWLLKFSLIKISNTFVPTAFICFLASLAKE